MLLVQRTVEQCAADAGDLSNGFPLDEKGVGSERRRRSDKCEASAEEVGCDVTRAIWLPSGWTVAARPSLGIERQPSHDL